MSTILQEGWRRGERKVLLVSSSFVVILHALSHVPIHVVLEAAREAASGRE